MKNITSKVLVVAALSGALLCGKANVARADEKLSDAEMKGVAGQQKLAGQECVQAGTGSCIEVTNYRNGKCVRNNPYTWKKCRANPNGILIDCGKRVISCRHYSFDPVDQYGNRLNATTDVCRDRNTSESNLYFWYDKQTGCNS